MRYRIVHKLHEVEATSSELDGKALAKADGTVQGMVRAKVAGFRHMTIDLSLAAAPH